LTELPVQRLLLEVVSVILLAFRRKDHLDIEEIFAVSFSLDVDYIKTWAARLDVVGRLKEFL
jgi:hypothetical protein